MLQRTRIKFCGMMRPEDVELACARGADAIGMVFYPRAGRCVSMEVAEAIMAAAPAFMTAVGLFVDQPRVEILQIATRLGLSEVQLHGHESPEDVAALKPLAVLKAIRVTRDGFESEIEQWKTAIGTHQLTNLKGLVLETGGTKEAGGTGIENDWEYLLDCQSRKVLNGLPPIIAAGGLKPENVGDVIRRLRPFAVDVSSGIELSRGMKSAEKVRRFVEEVRKADNEK